MKGSELHKCVSMVPSELRNEKNRIKKVSNVLETIVGKSRK